MFVLFTRQFAPHGGATKFGVGRPRREVDRNSHIDYLR